MEQKNSMSWENHMSQKFSSFLDFFLKVYYNLLKSY